MLKNKYQEVIVGLNLLSLVRGIISLKRKRSTLLINDERFLSESYHSNFLSELEILSLIRLGNKYQITELVDLRHFLIPATLKFITPEKRLSVGDSPHSNLREVLRKYPEFLAVEDLDLFYAENPADFNRTFMLELLRYEGQNYEMSTRTKGLRFDLQGPKWLKGIYSRFAELLNREYTQSQDLKYAGLLHLLGVSAEEKLKTRLTPEEVPFYFFRLLSPIYRLQDFFLTTQLKHRLIMLGGDYKESTVQYWQLHGSKFENLLLASFEGVISADRVLFFSHLPEEVPFSVKGPYAVYRKTQMAPEKRFSAPHPPTSLTFITAQDKLGSHRPYRVLAQSKDLSYYHWPYPELPGSKSGFYDRHLLESFSEDAKSLPFEKGSAVLGRSTSVTLDLRPLKTRRKSEAAVLNRLPLEISESDRPVKGFEYWGPFRYQSLGQLALCYGIEGN
ncbi:MAG TPA: hypothetical protein VNJ01_02730 [Bacteriovoracaceae bacterium]|nr:hypothetical protein [Bacteriovoracaceae bacterium]